MEGGSRRFDNERKYEMDDSTSEPRITEQMWIVLDAEAGYAPVREIIRIEVWPDPPFFPNDSPDMHEVRAYLAHPFILPGEGPEWDVQDYATLHSANSFREANYWAQGFIKAMGGFVPYKQLSIERDKEFTKQE